MELTIISTLNTSNARHRLADEFATAARLYSEAVVKLVQSQKWPDHERLRRDVLEAQRKADQVGVEYQEFVATHNW